MFPPNQNLMHQSIPGQQPPSLLHSFIFQPQNNYLNSKPPPLMDQQQHLSVINQHPPSLLSIPTSNLTFPSIGGSFNYKTNIGPVPLMKSLAPPLVFLQHPPVTQLQSQPVSLFDLNPLPNIVKDDFNNSRKYKIIRHDLNSTLELMDYYKNEHDRKKDNTVDDDISIEIQSTDYNHGLSASIFSTINLTNDCLKSVNRPTNELNESTTSPQSLLALKVDTSTELSTKKTSNKNLFPVLGESIQENFKTKITPIENILNKPGRDKRPSRILIIIRGPPGSGKSYISNLIKQEEEKYVSSSDKPKIISIDNYFMSEHEKITSNNKKEIVMKYEYDNKMDESYQRSLIKSFKKTLDDYLFKFIIVDMINQKMNQINDMSNYAKIKGFQTYIIDLNLYDAQYCFERNIHNRSLDDIKKIIEEWEPLSSNYNKLDVACFLDKNRTKIVESAENEIQSKDQLSQKSKWNNKMNDNEFSKVKKFKNF